MQTRTRAMREARVTDRPIYRPDGDEQADRHQRSTDKQRERQQAASPEEPSNDCREHRGKCARREDSGQALDAAFGA